MSRRRMVRSTGPGRAPGDLEVVRQLLGTGAGGEKLGSVTSAEHWLATHELLPPEVELTEPDRLRLIEVREGLRGVVGRRRGARPDGEALARLEAALGELHYRLRLGDDGLPRFETDSEGFGAVLARLMGIIAASADLWPRLKVCGACDRAFYDASRTNVSKWCSDRCGDRVRARTLRRRRKYSGELRRR